VCHREHLLTDALDEDPELKMLLKLIDLLASCSEGENLFIESICQNIISINELLKVLDDWYCMFYNYLFVDSWLT